MKSKSLGINQMLREAVLNKDLDPTQEEINAAIVTIAKQFSHCNPLDIIGTLYHKLQCIQIRPNINMKPLYLRKISPSPIQREVIQSFYEVGYGYQKFTSFMQRLRLQILSKQNYVEMCETMALQLYQALQEILSQFNISVPQKNADQIKQLYIWMLNNKTYLNRQGQKLLNQFVGKIYRLSEVFFTYRDVFELYSLLSARFINFKPPIIPNQKKELILEDIGLPQFDFLIDEQHDPIDIDEDFDDINVDDLSQRSSRRHWQQQKQENDYDFLRDIPSELSFNNKVEQIE